MADGSGKGFLIFFFRAHAVYCSIASGMIWNVAMARNMPTAKQFIKLMIVSECLHVVLNFCGRSPNKCMTSITPIRTTLNTKMFI